MRRVSTAWLLRISRLTSASTSAICSAVIGSWWEKSKRVRLASTSEPFCCTCGPSTLRNAACIRWVAEWLRCGARARHRVHLRRDRVADCETAGLEHALVAEHLCLDLLRIVHRESAAAGNDLARVADLPAGLGVKRRAIEHDHRIVAGLDPLCTGAPPL